MAITLVISGVSMMFPTVGDSGWGNSATQAIAALAMSTLQKGGDASFTLQREVDLGPAFSFKASYFRSRTANSAAVGFGRLARTDVVSWRNATNTADLPLGVNASNQLTFAGSPVAMDTGILDEGVMQGTANSLNFVGSGVTASVMDGVATITVSAGGGGGGGSGEAPLHEATHELGGTDELHLDASQVTTGTFNAARISEDSVTQWQTSLILAASQIQSGQIADARISESSVLQHLQAMGEDIEIAASQVTSGTFADARISATSVRQHISVTDSSEIDFSFSSGAISGSLKDGTVALARLVSGSANRLRVTDASGIMIDASAITANQALVSNASGIPVASAVTDAQLAKAPEGYISLGTTATLTVADGISLLVYVAFNFTVTEVVGSITTAPTGSAATFQVRNVTAGNDILGSNLSISAGANSGSQTSIANGSLTKGQLLRLDCDQIGSTVAGAGIVVTLIGTRS